MKRITQIFAVILLFAIFKIPEVQAQSSGGGWLIDTTIIPITSGIWWGFTNTVRYPGAMDSMRAVVDGIDLDLGWVDGKPWGGTKDSQMDTLINHYGFHVTPAAVYNKNNSTLYNWVEYYTDARYTEWQVEGEYGDTSYLKHNSNVMEEDYDGDTTFIRLKPNAVCGEKELLWGPYYSQYVYELTDADTLAPTEYTAVFRMKLEDNQNPPSCPDPIVWSDNPETPICIIKVTQSSVDVNPSWHITGTYTIDSLIITLGELKSYFKNYPLIRYKLLSDSCQSNAPGEPNPQVNPGDMALRGNGYSMLTQRRYIQFKVIWLGNPNYLLSIDKITVSDEKGLEIITPNSQAVTNLHHQLDQLISYNSKINGWLGRDEPNSIDQYSPIKKVNEILNDYTSSPSRLWLPLMGRWGGAYDNPGSTIGIDRLSPWKEMKKRIGDMNIWQDIYYLDSPYCDTCSVQPPFGEDWKDANIIVTGELNYRQAYELSSNFGVSLQCGEIHIPGIAEQRNITDYEFLYETNLALMYGAKFLSLYTYFAQTDIGNCQSGSTCHAIVDFNPNSDSLIYAPKYTMLRHKISPRLKGLFGKTLKRLIPNFDFNSLGIAVTPSNENINYIKNISLISTPQVSAPIFEAGFFSNPESPDPTGNEDRYFILLKRYYPHSLGLQNFNVSFNNMSPYTNWQVSNFIDTAYYTITPDENGEFVSDFFQLFNGDAIFYRLAPVVKYGGKLILNETVTDGTALYNDMSIESGATLIVNGTYNAKANITVKAGGKIVAGTNGKIIFDPNKSITVEGNAEIKGFTNNKLSLEFSNSTAVGVEAQFGSNLSLSNCNIKNAIVGIKVENGSTANISYVDFTDCSDNAVVMFGFGNGENAQTLATPTVYRCTIENSSIGISIVNCDQLVLKENTINHCNLGIYLNMVSSAYISSNTILGWQSATGSPMPGISMSNGDGYLRNNTIRYHNFGVLLAFSSPDLGVNTIENNYKCGVYSSIGSFPNLVQQLANPQCWYPIGGCNVIRNNGTFTYLPPSTPEIQPDGAEIFLNSGDVLLSYGYNEISDDRTGIPTYLTIPLIKGTRSRGGSKEFFVDHNYWGTTGPSPIRFGTFEADYDPTADYCPLPDMPCSGNEIIIQTTDGQIVDTLDSRERESTEISALEESYAIADKLFYSGDLEGAKIIYEQIVAGPYTSEEKLFAYKKLYEIGEILKEDVAYFSSLQNAFNSILSVETDTLLIKTYNQSSILCDVSKKEYLTAISKFDNIIQQNPNSEEAVYAEIDIITTALNLDTTNSQLGKMGNGKYLVKGTSDYLSKLNDILQSKFGINSEEKEHIIPKEYSLYQNYPNPFNPTTTIKFDIPNDGLITLEIFDILGRRIATLVDDYKTAGRYEQVFNASSLASGVYVYKLQAGDFISSKKMLLIK